MADLLPGPVTPEPRATCSDCVMCPTADGTLPAAAYAFRPDIKCCSYTPELANFLVGGILADEDAATAAGRASVRERIVAGAAVTPLGLGPPPALSMLHRNSMNTHGVSEVLRCPHYVMEGGTCGIWRHRNALCTTWWCKHERGAVGREFWMALNELLTAVEQALARWCLLELDFAVGRLSADLLRSGVVEIGTLGPHDLAGRGDPSVLGMQWGEWAGREEEFYRACAAKVAPLAWRDVAEICGPDVGLFARVALDAWQATQAHEVPARLRLGSIHPLSIGEQGALVVTYSAFDPVAIPALLMTALHYFDGRPTKEAFRALAEERGLQLDDALLETLLDFRVFVGMPA